MPPLAPQDNHQTLLASEQDLETLTSPEYWRALCPKLHVGDSAFLDKSQQGLGLCLPFDRLRSLLDRDGYFVLTPESLEWQVSLEDMAESVRRLVSFGWDPLFLAVYDEAWVMAGQLGPLIERSSGGNLLNMDFLAWLIDPARGGKGFAPHRDRQPRGSVPASFREDGSPKYVTAWLPLLDAVPDNSCLYVIPRPHDPGYYDGDKEDEDPMQVALSQPGGFQNIRALPMRAGSALIFSHRLIHWGSATNPSCPHPRISLAFACSDAAYEAPYLRNPKEHLPGPTLPLRVALACSQAVNYNKRLSFTYHQLALFHRVFSAYSTCFDETYVIKVRAEFQWAKWSHAQQRMATRAATITATSSSSTKPPRESRRKGAKKQPSQPVKAMDEKDDALREEGLYWLNTLMS